MAGRRTLLFTVFIAVALAPRVTRADALVPRGTTCGLGHSANLPNPTCAGRRIQRDAPNGNCPPGWTLIQICDFGASSGTNFFACALAADTTLATLPEGTLCGYGHSGQPSPKCLGSVVEEGKPATCPPGYAYRAFGDFGASSGSGFFGCVATSPQPAAAGGADGLPQGVVCGLSHTCGAGNFCGAAQVGRNGKGCPPSYQFSGPVDMGASSGEGQYYCSHPCVAGLTSCGGACQDLTNDAANCGGCGNSCPSGFSCVGGSCSCVSPRLLCGGACVDPAAGTSNCGPVVPRGTLCGLGHTANFPNPTCAGNRIQQNAPNGNCPPGWTLTQICDLGAGAGTNFFACALAADTVLATLPQGTLCGYGHSGQPSPQCLGSIVREGQPASCPAGFNYTAFGDLGTSAGSGFFGCVAESPQPVASADADGLPQGVVCGLSHTCSGGNYCGAARVSRDGGGCPPNYQFSGPVDLGASSGEGQYSCTRLCAAGLTNCAGSCKDVSSDRANCSGCGLACSGGKICQGGACVCASGQLDCGGKCADPLSDPLHCGDCGTACPPANVCAGGTCVCPSPRLVCGGSCVDPSTDTSNCGGCGAACPPGFGCTKGSCVCPRPSEVCGGSCVNPSNDPKNCGGCGLSCSFNQQCCGGGCKELGTDPLNCGGCGRACPVDCSGTTRGTCANGACQQLPSSAVFVEAAGSRCALGTIIYPAYSPSAATACAERDYPGATVGPVSSVQRFTYSELCPVGSCNSAADCASWQTCTNGYCLTCQESSLVALSESDGLKCAEWRYQGCVVKTGSCRSQPSRGVVTIALTEARSCTADADCPAGQCLGGWCQPVGRPDGAICSKHGECGSGRCEGGLCGAFAGGPPAPAGCGCLRGAAGSASAASATAPFAVLALVLRSSRRRRGVEGAGSTAKTRP